MLFNNPHISIFNSFENFTGYNDWKGKRKAAPKLQSTRLKAHSSAIFGLTSRPFTASWNEFRGKLELMALSLDYYAKFLEKENIQMKQRHSLPHPVRQVSEHVSVQYFSTDINKPVEKNMTFSIQ